MRKTFLNKVNDMIHKESDTVFFTIDMGTWAIESLLEDYLKSMRDSFGAITDYDIVFDRTNNPDWLIREGAGLVDTIVELPGIAKRYIKYNG